MTARQNIEENLKNIVKEISGQEIPVELKISENSENGEYYSNIAMRLAGVLKKKPLDIAYEIKKEFESLVPLSPALPLRGREETILSPIGRESERGAKGLVIEKVEVANPGFVNFFLSEQALKETLKAVVEHEKFGDSDNLKDRKVMIEFIDPNPFKEFHIGHLYVQAVGESVARLIESQGADLVRACYQGDVGLHVAKAIYGMTNLNSELPNDESELSLRAQFLGKAYALGSASYEENEKIKEEINALNKTIYEARDEEVNSLYEKGRSWSLEYFDSIYARLGTKFDYFYFESAMAPVGLGLVKEYLSKKVFEESDGAVIFPGKKYGLHNRVFINSLGIPTYEAKEMALAPTKFKDFAYDESIIITGNEVDEYFRVVLKALAQIEPDLAKKTRHISHGMVRLPQGKMSSRTGNVITAEWLMDEVVSRIHREYPDMSDEVAEKVGLAAIKFAFLKVGIGHDIEFNIEESISLSGASGPYLLYTYVRTQSILAKNHSYKGTNFSEVSESRSMNQGESDKRHANSEPSANPEELSLMRHMVFFPEVVNAAAQKYSPNLVAEYLLELSQKFNLFYQKHQVVGNENRIELTKAVGNVLAHGLNLLGIETVERM